VALLEFGQVGDNGATSLSHDVRHRHGHRDCLVRECDGDGRIDGDG
jgi:hypothetical protein